MKHQHTTMPDAATHHVPVNKPWVWWLIVVWVVYNGTMLWHQKERIGWVASVCSAPQPR